MRKLIEDPPFVAEPLVSKNNRKFSDSIEGPYRNKDPSAMKLRINDFGVPFQRVGKFRFRRDSDPHFEHQLD